MVKIIIVEGIPYIDISACITEKSNRPKDNKILSYTDIQRLKEREHIKNVLGELKEKFKNE